MPGLIRFKTNPTSKVKRQHSGFIIQANHAHGWQVGGYC